MVWKIEPSFLTFILLFITHALWCAMCWTWSHTKTIHLSFWVSPNFPLQMMDGAIKKFPRSKFYFLWHFDGLKSLLSQIWQNWSHSTCWHCLFHVYALVSSRWLLLRLIKDWVSTHISNKINKCHRIQITHCAFQILACIAKPLCSSYCKVSSKFWIWRIHSSNFQQETPLQSKTLPSISWLSWKVVDASSQSYRQTYITK